MRRGFDEPADPFSLLFVRLCNLGNRGFELRKHGQKLSLLLGRDMIGRLNCRFDFLDAFVGHVRISSVAYLSTISGEDFRSVIAIARLIRDELPSTGCKGSSRAHYLPVALHRHFRRQTSDETSSISLSTCRV